MKPSVFVFYLIMLFVPVIAGCGLKPIKMPSENITISHLLDVIEKNLLEIRDFDGTAKIEADINGTEGSASGYIRYIYPSDFRIYVKGFAGIEMARLSSVGDTVTIYFPSDNIFIKEPRNIEIPQLLLPGLDVSPELLTVIIAGEIPPEDTRNEFLITLKQYTEYVELTMQRESLIYRYILDISSLRVMEEEKWMEGALQWKRTISGQNSFGGIYFPEKISFEKDGNILKLTFVSGKVNSGLTDKDLIMAVPLSAERIKIE